MHTKGLVCVYMCVCEGLFHVSRMFLRLWISCIIVIFGSVLIISYRVVSYVYSECTFLPMCWLCVDCVCCVCTVCVDCMLTVCWPCYWLCVYSVCWLHVDCVLTVCWPCCWLCVYSVCWLCVLWSILMQASAHTQQLCLRVLALNVCFGPTSCAAGTAHTVYTREAATYT